MNLQQFLVHVQHGSYEIFQLLLRYLANPELKALRLVVRPLSSELFPYMFRRMYFSAHSEDLHVLQMVLRHPRIRHSVEELVVDDTVYDDSPIYSIHSYQNLVLRRSPHLKSQPEFEMKSKLAYEFWMKRRQQFDAYKLACRDILYLKDVLVTFTNLKQVSILGRKRGSNFGSVLYWNEWQTPRHRHWSRLSFYEYLVPPSSHRPLSRSVDENTEGLRPLRLLCACLDNHQGFKIRSLRVSSVMRSPAQAREGRYARGIKSPYVPDLLAYQRQFGAGCLNLLLDVPFFVMSHEGKYWNAVVDECISRASSTLEELTLSFVDMEGFWSYLDAVSKAVPLSGTEGGVLRSCSRLRKLRLEHCSSAKSPLSLFQYLHKHTSVREIELHGCSSEAVSWGTVLNYMKEVDIMFTRFEMRSCSCVMDTWALLGIDLANSPAAPWNGSSEDICTWLRGETSEFPIWQGPG